MFGGRSPRFIARQALEWKNYSALARMCRTCAHPLDFAGRYFMGSGSYPACIRLRTPIGVIAPTLYSHHDVLTVNEIFCRLDYYLPPDGSVVVDIGSNIGISALYFLTRSPGVRCFLFEPDPRNTERLRANLSAYQNRYELICEAVADRSGIVSFGREATGRLGGIDARLQRLTSLGTLEDVIEVPCGHINDVLAGVIAREDHIDLLKIDTEGMEDRTVAAIDPELLSRVRVLCYETSFPVNPAPELFDMAFATETARLTRLS